MKILLLLCGLTLISACSTTSHTNEPVDVNTSTDMSLQDDNKSEVMSYSKEMEARVLKAVEPRYPRKAAMRGISGFVRFQFDLTDAGYVKNLEIVESQPEGVFDKEAIRSIKQWEFDSTSKKRTGLTYVLEFKVLQYKIRYIEIKKVQAYLSKF